MRDAARRPCNTVRRGTIRSDLCPPIESVAGRGKAKKAAGRWYAQTRAASPNRFQRPHRFRVGLAVKSWVRADVLDVYFAGAEIVADLMLSSFGKFLSRYAFPWVVICPWSGDSPYPL